MYPSNYCRIFKIIYFLKLNGLDWISCHVKFRIFFFFFVVFTKFKTSFPFTVLHKNKKKQKIQLSNKLHVPLKFCYQILISRTNKRRACVRVRSDEVYRLVKLNNGDDALYNIPI